MNFVEELKWRGMLHDMMPGTQYMSPDRQESSAHRRQL